MHFYSTRSLARIFLSFGLATSGLLARGQSTVTPDITFGSNGSAPTNLVCNAANFSATSAGSPNWMIMGQAVVSNSRILVCGTNNNQWALQCYLANGTLDTSFGVNGSVTTIFPGYSAAAHGLVVQPDGKLVVVGGITGSIGLVWAAARYTAQGQLDPTFGTNGLAYPNPTTASPSELARVVMLPDGSFLAAASYARASPTRLLHLLANGLPDSNFYNGAAFGPAIGGMFQELVTQPDGKVLLVTDGPGSATQPGRVGRYTTTGQPDPTFGINGEVTIQATSNLLSTPTLPRPTYLHAIAVQSNGQIVVGGHATDGQVSGTTGDFPVLFRLNTDGSPDVAFNTATKRSLVFTGGLTALAVQSNGQLIVGGSAKTSSFSTPSLLLARYTTAGALDPGFGSATPGVYINPVGLSALVRGLTILPATGQLLAWEGSATATTPVGSYEMRLTRYSAAIPTASRAATTTPLTLNASPVPTTGLLRLVYTLPAAAAVAVTVQDQLGRTAAHFQVAPQAAGTHEAVVDLQALAPGTYFCTLQAAALRQISRIVVAP